MQRLIKLKIIKFNFEARGFDKEQIEDFIKECEKKEDKKITITNEILLKHILELKEDINKLREELNKLKKNKSFNY